MFREKLLKVKEYGWAKQLVYNLALALFLALIICIVLIKSMSLRLDEVLSDSMYPKFSDQDIVIVKPQKEYKVGDIIEFKEGSKNVAHELIAIDETTGKYIAKGVFHGASTQEVDKENINGKVVAIWFNGRSVYHFVKDNYFLILTMVVGAWVLSITFTNELEIKKHNILKI